jgi:hypothetical protein
MKGEELEGSQEGEQVHEGNMNEGVSSKVLKVRIWKEEYVRKSKMRLYGSK